MPTVGDTELTYSTHWFISIYYRNGTHIVHPRLRFARHQQQRWRAKPHPHALAAAETLPRVGISLCLQNGPCQRGQWRTSAPAYKHLSAEFVDFSVLPEERDYTLAPLR